jgi:molecular chaperone DnaK
MVSDAETHAEEDRKFRELVDTRNQADGLIHAAEKTLTEAGEKASSEERLAIENAVSDLKTALESDDKDAIDTKTAALGEASSGLAQKLYAEQAAEASADGGDGAESADDVVDAEFEEVDKSEDEEKDEEKDDDTSKSA